MKNGKGFLVLCVSLISFSAFAMDRLPEKIGFPDREAKMREALSGMKTIESSSHNERIAILREAEACVQSAQTMAAYKECEKTENDRRKSSNESAKSKREALKESLHGKGSSRRELRLR